VAAPPVRIAVVVGSVIALAVAAFVLALAAAPLTIDRQQVTLLVVLGGVLLLARRAPMPLARNQHLMIGTAPLFAATLLLPAWLAIGMAGAVVLVADRSRRARWLQAGFNAATAALLVATGAAVFALVSASTPPDDLPPPQLLAAAFLTALSMYAVNVCLVELIVAVQRRHVSPAEFVVRRRLDALSEGALYALGLLIVVLAEQQAWALPLLAVPVLLVYRSLHQSLALQNQLEQRAQENLVLLRRAEAAGAEAEVARAHAASLAEASAVFVSALDLDETLRNVARAAVPAFADGATVDLIEGTGEIRHVAAAHRDPAREAALQELQRCYPFHLTGPRTLHRSLRQGRSLAFRDITDSQLSAAGRDAGHRRLLQELGPTSLLIVPLMTRGRLLGAFSFLTTEPARQLGPAEVARAEELARRAAMAIDNARLYREVQQALDEATAAVAVRDDFLSIASHELLTPLTALKGQAQLAARRLRRGQSEDVPVLIQQAEVQISRLTNLVRTLLDVSRLAEGRFPLDRRPMALTPLLVHVVGLERDVDPSRRIELDCPDTTPRVLADADRLELVFVNLLSNARKYSPEGTPVQVRVEATEDSVAVSVEDQGSGISAEDQVHIFERFRRGSGVDDGISGMGLGLYIAHEIVRAHGGRLTVVSAPGEGSSFTVTLPRLAAEGANAAGSGNQARPTDGSRSGIARALHLRPQRAAGGGPVPV
jgi:signal transduction histidine kinase